MEIVLVKKDLRGGKVKMKFRVYDVVPTSFGHEKARIQLFQTITKANSYALKLVKDLRKSAKETDDDESVLIEDLITGRIVRAWRNEGEGIVAYYKGGW